MPDLFLPWVSLGSELHTRPDTPNPRGFGIGIRSQHGPAHQARALELLQPPCWHNWASWWPEAGGYPCIWNPYIEMHAAWSAQAVGDGAQWWLVGNEPLSAHERVAYWTPEQMVTQANVFHGTTGAEYVLCGEVPDDPGLDYCRELLRLGANPVAWHWHIYQYYASDWQKALERCLRFDDTRSIIISETNARGRDVDGQRELMDCIMEALAKYYSLHAVMWFVSAAPDTPTEVWLVDGPEADAGLTATGRHYVEVTG